MCIRDRTWSVCAVCRKSASRLLLVLMLLSLAWVQDLMQAPSAITRKQERPHMRNASFPHNDCLAVRFAVNCFLVSSLDLSSGFDSILVKYERCKTTKQRSCEWRTPL